MNPSNVTPITVRELIEFLQTQPQEALVAYEMYSEQLALGIDDMKLVELCPPRPDGWIQNKRPDIESQTYLVFPGN